ncbi:MAG: L-fucose:H+ symporter permease [Gemmatimonadetes bacterium]|nr:L-fucose:H+ symporter permease [Gemmatimonadota bacterium]
MTQKAPFTERRYVVPLVLVTSLFLLWALGVNLNDILIPHLKRAFGLTDFQSSLIQTAFFGGYFLAALPAGWWMRRVGYRKGILTGLLVCATGAFLFIPASYIRLYPIFLFALFVMACGQCFLEVGANPYVTTLGPEETAPWRLNTAQSANSVGAVITPIIGATFILSGAGAGNTDTTAMTPERLEAFRAMEAGMVRGPYLVIAGIFLFVAFLFWRTHLPEVAEETVEITDRRAARRGGGILSHGHLVRGVLAQFLYVGAQVGAASFVIRFVEHTVPGTPDKAAARFLMYHLIGFMLGRFFSAGAMKYMSAPRLLAFFAVGGMAAAGVAVGGTGMLAVWMVVLLGFFNSMMFPTIFALSLEGLGPHRKLGASLLVMSIVGGAVLPAIMGLVSDRHTIQTAFLVPIVCYAYVFYFAVRGHRPTVRGPNPIAATA